MIKRPGKYENEQKNDTKRVSREEFHLMRAYYVKLFRSGTMFSWRQQETSDGR